MEVRGIAPGPLFTNRRGGRVSTAYYRERMPRLARRAGVEGRVHCHGLRHAFAERFYRQTRDVVTLSKILGHSDIRTTQEYLTKIGVQPEIEEAMESIAW